MSLLLPLLAAALPVPLTDVERGDLRCVAVLAITADAQANQPGFGNLPAVGAIGRRYAGIVGAAGVEAGRDLESERNLMIEAAIAARETPIAPDEAMGCLATATTRLAEDAPLPVPTGK